MSNSVDKTRYIPFRKKDIINMIINDKAFSQNVDEKKFKQVCEMLESIFHFEFYHLLEKLKEKYYFINPDIRRNTSPANKEIDLANEELLKILKQVLNDANYDQITKEEIESAYENSALVGISVDINLSDYEFIEIYARGHRTDKFTIKSFFGLKTREKEHNILERVLLIARLKDHVLDSGKKLSGFIQSDSTIIKLFKDVPMEDLEILFPNSKVVMSLKDKLLLFVPAIAGGVPLLVTKVIPALVVAFIVISAYFGVKGTIEENQMKQAVAVLSALGALGGFIFKQISKYKSKKFHFQKELSDNLYFRNLVNNAGVFYSLIDSAEEEEFKEAILAYYFLYTSEAHLDEQSLDNKIEQWFQKDHKCILDFECSDALAKLERFNLLEIGDNNKMIVVSMDKALKILDYRWDNYFKYN